MLLCVVVVVTCVCCRAFVMFHGVLCYFVYCVVACLFLLSCLVCVVVVLSRL